jgi:hypothetical protein
MDRTIEDFSSTWSHVRGQLTYDFVRAVPDTHWTSSPHPRYRTFAKQVRHLICVQGVYLHGLNERVTDFSKKHSHYDGPLDRASLLQGLHEKDAALLTTLANIGKAGPERFEIDWFGQRIGLAGYLHVLIQHESIHHGEWSFYATFGGFATPVSWQMNWGL